MQVYQSDVIEQVVVARTYEQFTARRVLTSEWLDGEKLSQSQASDVGALVNLGVICYLKQLLDTGFFHAGTPHHKRPRQLYVCFQFSYRHNYECGIQWRAA